MQEASLAQKGLPLENSSKFRSISVRESADIIIRLKCFLEFYNLYCRIFHRNILCVLQRNKFNIFLLVML